MKESSNYLYFYYFAVVIFILNVGLFVTIKSTIDFILIAYLNT